MKKMLGVMLDCSRNAVMNTDAVKQYAYILKQMGYNTVMLYTEDTYEVDNQPYFGHLRGRYTKEELKEIDAYCVKIGIELIPCIQTLAHLNCIFRWRTVYGDMNDCDDILLADDENTYKLIDDMLSTLSECFTSRKIHIGMDEADRVGTGMYRYIHGDRDRFDIINRHLHKVCDIAGKYGLEPIIWSDMFLRLAVDSNDYYKSADISSIRKRANLPENIGLVYWDYYTTDYNRYVDMINANKAFDREVYFAGGAWTWKGFAPDNNYSMETTKVALEACRDCGVDNILFTVWGDDGNECSKFAVLPALMYAAEYLNGNTDMDSIKAKFKKITGVDFDSFMLLDALDTPGGGHVPGPLSEHKFTPSKYLFYNDSFMGLNDWRCSAEDNEYYSRLAEKLESVDGGDFAPVFQSFCALARVLAVKSDIGVRTRKAYLCRDMTEIKELIEEYGEVIVRIQEFHSIYRNMWFMENKPHGFDVQDMRIGGVVGRMISCKERLESLLNGSVSSIPELEEPVLQSEPGPTWSRMFTPNAVTHRL